MENGFISRNLGHIITVGGFVIAFAMAWATMQARDIRQDEELAKTHNAIGQNSIEIKQLRRDFSDSLTAKEGDLRREMDRRNEELRKSFEGAQAKTDAKLELLTKELTEIKSSLRSLETNIAWIVRQDKRAPK